MRCLVQRVSEASVTIGESITGQIGKGCLILLGISKDDDESVADKMARKILDARIFEDGKGKTNLSLRDVGGQLLIVSQFTLYADYRHGNRPGFSNAGTPERAEALYDYFINKCKDQIAIVEHGVFGADMKVRLINDGPFTILYDSEELASNRDKLH